MGNKTRLNEATVRRFMKLAKLPTVNEQFFNEEEEPMEEPAMEDPAAEEPAAEEAPAEGEAGPDEVEMAERHHGRGCLSTNLHIDWRPKLLFPIRLCRLNPLHYFLFVLLW